MKKSYSGCTQDSKQNDAKEAEKLQREVSRPSAPSYKKMAASLTNKRPAHYKNG